MDRQRKRFPGLGSDLAPLPPDAPVRLRDEPADLGSGPMLRSVYLALIGIVVISATAALLWPEIPWVERFAPNLATDSFGILLTVVVVQRVLERQERARRLRGSVGALRKGARALTDLVEAWGTLIKGSLRRVPTTPLLTVDELLAPHVSESLATCNPLAVRETAEGDAERWVEWGARRVLSARNALASLINTYAPSLDPAYVELMDELVDDAFLPLLEELAADPSLDPRTWRTRMNMARGQRAAHFERLLAAVQLHNELASEAARVRSRRTAPVTGSIGVELALDFDLRARDRFDTRWWQSTPAPGSLSSDSAATRASEPGLSSER